MINQDEEFFLKGNIAFTDRQKSIFGALDVYTPPNTKQRFSKEEFKKAESKTVVDGLKRELKHFRGQESIFKAPEAPLKRPLKVKVPDFIKSPQKWKRYKMSGEVMTDKCNTAAAMTFLQEMKDRQEPMDVDKIKGPILFNKHISKADEGDRMAVEEKSKITFVNSKTVMPEYVVGQKVKKSVTFKKVAPAERPTSSIKLDHLNCDDE